MIPLLMAEYRKQKDLGNKVGALDNEELMAYIRENSWALVVELGEAAKETGWKPWATSNHFNREAFLGELADAQLFLDNLKLAALTSDSEEAVYELEEEFSNVVDEKIQQATRRQQEGYTGIKCPGCHEDKSKASISGFCPCGYDWRKA